MQNILGISGSTILSNALQFNELFRPYIQHIEIGEFDTAENMDHFFSLLSETQLSFGVHAPLFRKDSKYDLIHRVHYDPSVAIKQLEEQAERLSAMGAQYLLVHFPYFHGKVNADPNEMIAKLLPQLSRIQSQYRIPIVCEPKLGAQYSSFGIEYLHQFSHQRWADSGIHICLDIGDYLIAKNDLAMEYMSQWMDFTKVVHLHNVEFINKKYYWRPVHPDDEGVAAYNIQPIIEHLSKLDNIFFILEHTPHRYHNPRHVDEGIRWVHHLLYNGSNEYTDNQIH